MRGSPSCAVAVRRSVFWCSAVAVVAIAALLAMAAWLLTSSSGEEGQAWVVAALAAAVVVLVAASLMAHRPLVLRWDGMRWWLRPFEEDRPELEGRLQVAIDLGFFMLLRFFAAGARPSRASWIPVDRKGLEAEWHAFRCAVYSPRPAAGPGAADPPLP